MGRLARDSKAMKGRGSAVSTSSHIAPTVACQCDTVEVYCCGNAGIVVCQSSVMDYEMKSEQKRWANR